MKAASAVGIAVALVGLLVGVTMEGESPMALFNLPAVFVVFGGTFGAAMASVSFEQVKAIPVLYRIAFTHAPLDFKQRIGLLVEFADKARREGLLALDEAVGKVDDEFARKGLQLVVDGSDPEVIREILESEVDGAAARHKQGAVVFEKAGGFAPTMGILGTVMGLVNVLGNLDRPETLGPLIAGAFMATLYGVGSANVVFLPVAYRLKGISEEEVEFRTMTIEGILAIQAGDNPRIVRERLISFLPPAERQDVAQRKAGAPAPAAEPEPVAEKAAA